MDLRGRRLKLTAVAVLVVLTLTGFSTGRHSGGTGGDGSGSGGGGCSSSSQDHDSSSSTSGGGAWSGTDDDDDDYDYGSGGSNSTGSSGSGSGSGSGSAETLQDATAELVGCPTEQNPYATVAVTNPNDRGAYFTVTVDFLDAASDRVEQRTWDEYVAAHDTLDVQVDLSSPGVAAKVDHCEAEPYATVN